MRQQPEAGRTSRSGVATSPSESGGQDTGSAQSHRDPTSWLSHLRRASRSASGGQTPPLSPRAGSSRSGREQPASEVVGGRPGRAVAATSAAPEPTYMISPAVWATATKQISSATKPRGRWSSTRIRGRTRPAPGRRLRAPRGDGSAQATDIHQLGHDYEDGTAARPGSGDVQPDLERRYRLVEAASLEATKRMQKKGPGLRFRRSGPLSAPLLQTFGHT